MVIPVAPAIAADVDEPPDDPIEVAIGVELDEHHASGESGLSELEFDLEQALAGIMDELEPPPLVPLVAPPGVPALVTVDPVQSVLVPALPPLPPPLLPPPHPPDVLVGRGARGVRAYVGRQRRGEEWPPFHFVRKGNGWEATCPYHRGTDSAPRCRKNIPAAGDTDEDIYKAYLIAKEWCLLAPTHTRKYSHLRDLPTTHRSEAELDAELAELSSIPVPDPVPDHILDLQQGVTAIAAKAAGRGRGRGGRAGRGTSASAAGPSVAASSAGRPRAHRPVAAGSAAAAAASSESFSTSSSSSSHSDS